MKKIFVTLPLLFVFALSATSFQPANGADEKAAAAPIAWNRVLNQDKDWYRSAEAARIADQVLWYQKSSGGWDKNLDMATPLGAAEKATLLATKAADESTIDNGATYTQLRFLAKIVTANQGQKTAVELDKYRAAFDKGLDYLFAAQYANGGYPQFFPLRQGYYTHITFNDNAMIGVMKLLREVAEKDEDFKFVDEARRQKAETAGEKATELTLKLQVEVAGRKTIWAAQYDENSLQPATARKYEMVALTAGESVGIVRFLMLDEQPKPSKIAAIEAAINWYRQNQIVGIRWVKENGENLVKKEPNAPPLWARFTQIETMKPLFSGRDGVIRYDVMEIEAERRNGYAWYVTNPNQLLDKDYPQWREKLKKNGIMRE